MGNTLPGFLAGLCGLAIGVTVAGSAGATQDWDQAAVTALAADLAKATRSLKTTLRQEPQPGGATGVNDRSARAFWETIDGLEKATRQLATRTKDGKGYEDTLPIAKKIQMLVRDAEQHGAKLFVSGFVEEKIAPVEDLLARLEPYYFLQAPKTSPLGADASENPVGFRKHWT